jgi:predicted HTH transcriptional regulator
MRIYKDLDMVEHLGSGMNRILSFYKKESFILNDMFLRIVFHSNTNEIKTTQETKKLSSREKIILELKKDSSLTREELATLVGISANAIKQHLSKLKNLHKIKRVGSTKAGYWEILDDK